MPGIAKRAQAWLTKANHFAVWLVVTALNIFALVALLAASRNSDVLNGAAGLLLLFTLPLLGLAPATLLHELGHAIAARLCGWRVWIICVGPVLVRFSPRLIIETRPSLGGDAGGFVLPAPRRPEQATKLRKIIVTAGGPIASIAGAALAFWIAAPWVEDRGWEGLLAAVIYVFGISSVTCAVLTLWPTRDRRGVGNDIVQILDTLRLKPDPRQVYFRYALALIEYGFQPEEWDAHVAREIDVDLASATPSEGARLVAFLQALTRHDFERARALALEPDKQQLGATHYLHAWRSVEDGDFAAADDALARSKGAGFHSAWLMQVREIALIGVLAASGDRADAKDRYNRLRHALWSSTPLNRAISALLDRAMQGPVGAALNANAPVA